MADVKIELNSDGIRELLKSGEVAGFLEEKANEIVGRTSGNYNKSTYSGKGRVNVSIYTEDEKTYYKNLRNNELLKVLR